MFHSFFFHMSFCKNILFNWRKICAETHAVYFRRDCQKKFQEEIPWVSPLELLGSSNWGDFGNAPEGTRNKYLSFVFRKFLRGFLEDCWGISAWIIEGIIGSIPEDKFLENPEIELMKKIDSRNILVKVLKDKHAKFLKRNCLSDSWRKSSKTTKRNSLKIPEETKEKFHKRKIPGETPWRITTILYWIVGENSCESLENLWQEFLR